MPAPRLQAEVPVLVFPGALPVESLVVEIVEGHHQNVKKPPFGNEGALAGAERREAPERTREWNRKLEKD